MFDGDPLGHFIQSPTSGQPVLKPSCPELLPLVETAPGLARVRPSPLTWLLIHIQQRDVIIQVGHGTLGGAAPSPLRSGKHFPGEMQGALPATLLVAAMEKGGRRDEPQGSWVSGEGGARPRLPHEPWSHTVADISHRTFVADFQKPAPDFFPVPSPPGPLGATIPLGRQMVTAAITQGEGMITRSTPHIKVTKAGESCLCCHVAPGL